MPWIRRGGISYVTALPSNPVDGQEIYYAADATNGVIWHLRYRAASSSSYKWEFVGGPPLFAFVATAQSTTSGSYTALSTAGPSVSLPLAGDYDVCIKATITNDRPSSQFVPTTARMSYDIGATTAVDADSIQVNGDTNGNGTIYAKMSVSGTRRKTSLSAVTLTAKYRSEVTSNGAVWADRTMVVTPVRVG